MNISKLNAAFTRLTRFPCPSTYYSESSWVDWLGCLPHDPPTEGDLELVVRYVKRNLRPAGPYLPNSLRFSNLIANTQNFLELRSMARAERRVKPPTPRDKVLELTGRTASTTTEPVTAGTALERTKLAAQLRKFNETL